MNGAEANAAGLEAFANGDAAGAELILKRAVRLLPEHPGILVNLGLALMQQGFTKPAERCYQLAWRRGDRQVRRSAAKNLGLLKLWCGAYTEGWAWHAQRFEGEAFLQRQWQGENLNGELLTVWNDVGMGDAFQFVRYTLPLVQRGERVRFAVHPSQVALFRGYLAWPLEAVVSRNRIDTTAGIHIPLMSLVGLIDPSTTWGRTFEGPTFIPPSDGAQANQTKRIGVCWASNPMDRSMHAHKSTTAEALGSCLPPTALIVSLQTGDEEGHQRLACHSGQSLRPAQGNWLQTLEAITNCERVVSVDTAVAHLAAGAGINTTLLLSKIPDWRWRTFPEPDQNPSRLWYSSINVAPLPAPLTG